MFPRQMNERCPGARPLGAAVLMDWRFIITTRGMANIEPVKGCAVHGALWRCTLAHIHRLDQFEGVNWRNYVRRMAMVEPQGGSRLLPAFTYVSARRYKARARPDYLLSTVVPGAQAFGLPTRYISELESWLPDYPTGAANARYRGRRRRRRIGQ